MKTILAAFIALALAEALVGAQAGNGRASQASPSSAERVGVYDSRLVAYAFFWTEAEQRRIEALALSAKTAKQNGDTAAFEARSNALAEHQKQMHLQVFSTAPATFAMAALRERLPALQLELGVARFVSQWDEEALAAIDATNRVDVTDRLVAEFTVPPHRAEVLRGLRKTKPLPLAEAQRLAAAGKL